MNKVYFILLLFIKTLSGMSNEASSSGRDLDEAPTQEQIRAKNERLELLERQLAQRPAGSHAQVRASGTFSVTDINDLPYARQLASAASDQARQAQQALYAAATTAAQVSSVVTRSIARYVRIKRQKETAAKKLVERNNTTPSQPISVPQIQQSYDPGECPTIDPACQKTEAEQENEQMRIEEKTRQREFELAMACGQTTQAGNSISIPHEANQPQKHTREQERRVGFAEDVLTQPIVITQYEGSTEANANGIKTNEQEKDEVRTKDQETQTSNQTVLLLPVKIDQETQAPLRGYVSESEYRKMNQACCFCGACIAIIIFNLCNRIGFM